MSDMHKSHDTPEIKGPKKKLALKRVKETSPDKDSKARSMNIQSEIMLVNDGTVGSKN